MSCVEELSEVCFPVFSFLSLCSLLVRSKVSFKTPFQQLLSFSQPPMLRRRMPGLAEVGNVLACIFEACPSVRGSSQAPLDLLPCAPLRLNLNVIILMYSPGRRTYSCPWEGKVNLGNEQIDPFTFEFLRILSLQRYSGLR